MTSSILPSETVPLSTRLQKLAKRLREKPSSLANTTEEIETVEEALKLLKQMGKAMSRVQPHGTTADLEAWERAQNAYEESL